MDTDKLSFWLNRWSLIPDGEIFITHTSTLLPVKTATHGIKAMLKVTDDADEQTGNALMAWWEGNGAAQVMAYEKEAILLARATGIASLSTMSKNGQDKEACRILCATANRLHSKSDKPWSMEVFWHIAPRSLSNCSPLRKMSWYYMVTCITITCWISHHLVGWPSIPKGYSANEDSTLLIFSPIRILVILSIMLQEYRVFLNSDLRSLLR